MAALKVYDLENIYSTVRELSSSILEPRLRQIAKKHPSVGNVRGTGFFWALEFVSDQEAKTPLGAEAMSALGAAAKEAGVWPMVSGHRVHIAPPLTSSAAELQFFLDVLDSAIDKADAAL